MTSIYYGQNADLSLVSGHHGAFSLGYCESFECEPQHNRKKLYFFNKQEGMPVVILEGAAGRFSYLETEEKYIMGALLDKNVRTMDVVNDDPAAYQEFQIMLNARNNIDGKLDMGILVKRARAAGNPTSMTPRDEQHGSFSFDAATRYLVKGAGIGYLRMLADSPGGGVTVLSTDENFPAAGPFEITLPNTAESLNVQNTSATRLYLYVLKNGVDVGSTGFTMTSTKFTIASAPATTDVWEVFYAYKPV